MKKILVTVPMEPEQKKRLEAQMPQAEYTYLLPKEVKDEHVAEADIILGNLLPQQLAPAKHLEWLQLNTSGADNYAAPGVLPEGTLLTNSTGAYGLAISEYLLAQTLFLKKKFGIYLRNQIECKWEDAGKVTAIQGSITLVVGLGDIGGQYAQKMSALGSHVYGIRRNRSECPAYLEKIGTFDDLDKWLPLADIVALALPNTPQTIKLFDAKRFSNMKKGSIILNVGRGTSIDTNALYDALVNGPIMGAAVDVVDPEPLPQDHPLWKCENLLLTPHVAGDFHLQETLDQIIEIFIRNLGRYAKGESLENPVDMNTGYRRSVL